LSTSEACWNMVWHVLVELQSCLHAVIRTSLLHTGVGSQERLLEQAVMCTVKHACEGLDQPRLAAV
jgi:hypothetical protein